MTRVVCTRDEKWAICRREKMEPRGLEERSNEEEEEER